MTDLMSLFTVTETLHADCAECDAQIEYAAVHARVTGSVGASHSTVHPDGTEHRATVKRNPREVES